MLKIVVVDGHTLNPGDLSWAGLDEQGQLKVYESTPAEKVVERCLDAEIVITNKVVFNKKTIDSLPKLKYIGVTATGYNVIDIEAAKEKQIIVTNVPTYAAESVAQTVFALLLELTHHAGHHSDTVKEGKWCKSEHFSYWDYPLVELSGLTMGVVGYGNTGRATARIARAFGINVLAYDIDSDKVDSKDAETVDLDTLLSRSDVISLNCPLTGETQGLINADSLSRMKETTFLINTGRGPLVNEKDLADALNSGRLAGAAVDVLSTEPPDEDNPLLTARNCFITPHIAWATKSARSRLMEVTVNNITAFIKGKPENVVS
ncbi:MAG: D-2-hydroxyacid dehydrogenase [Planctomycetota bacterium]|jgi:glycerate dehydrogenase